MSINTLLQAPACRQDLNKVLLAGGTQSSEMQKTQMSINSPKLNGLVKTAQ